ncbi:MAG TPA: SDR family oxidoreductase [Paenibacillaceae bacterium]
MELNLQGKTAIVTGGSAGIGLAVARALYGEGVNVVLVARDRSRLENARQSILQEPHLGNPEVELVDGDIRQAETVERAVRTTLERFGRIDILVNNAGAAQAGSFLELPEEAFLDAWNLKLLGYIRFVRAVAPHMMERRDGRIVNIIGQAARTPSPYFLAGSTANAALLNFTKGISKELAKYNVRINAISPGSTATERAERLAEQYAKAKGISVEEQKAEMAAAIPLGRLVDPADIAAMVLLLVSDRASSLTGAEILIDGGQQPGI